MLNSLYMPGIPSCFSYYVQPFHNAHTTIIEMPLPVYPQSPYASSGLGLFSLAL
jgi:hypothetical protein